jgi:hypothetical protein
VDEPEKKIIQIQRECFDLLKDCLKTQLDVVKQEGDTKNGISEWDCVGQQ